MPAATAPLAGDVHVNTPLTNFSQKYLQKAEAFVGMRAMPNAPVAKQSDLYYEFDRSDFNRDEAEERADGTQSKGGGFDLSTNPYFAKVYAFHKDVTDRQRANQDSQIALDQSAAQFVAHKMLIKRERLFAAAYFATSIWFNGGSSASAGHNVDWSAASSDPIADVRGAIQSVQGITGYRPNRLLMGRQAYDTLLDNDSVLSRITGGATTEIIAKVQRQLLAQIFEVDEIFVMDAIYNTGNEGDGSAVNQNETNAFIGGDMCLAYYAPSTVGLNEPTAGVQFSWTGFLGSTPSGYRVKRFRMEAEAADRVEAEMAFDYKVTGPELGYLFTSVSSA